MLKSLWEVSSKFQDPFGICWKLTNRQLCNLQSNIFICLGRSPLTRIDELGVSEGPCQFGFWHWCSIRGCQHTQNDISKTVEHEVAEGWPWGRERRQCWSATVYPDINCELQLLMFREALFVNTPIYLSLARAAGRKLGRLITAWLEKNFLSK